MLLKGHKGFMKGRSLSLYNLSTIEGFEKFDSYLVDSEGFIYSGKGG